MNVSIHMTGTIVTNTFAASEGQSEGLLIGNLAHDFMTGTDAHDLYCFVATENEKIIGAIFFSRLTFDPLTFGSNVDAFLLGPVAIDASCQGKGIGQKLINFGLNTLKENGVELAFTYGDPKFYSKVGFNLIAETLVKAPLVLTYPEGWLGQSLLSDKIEPIAGNSYCVAAINRPEYW